MSNPFDRNTQKTSREPEDVTRFRQESVTPFLRGILGAPRSQAVNPFAQAASATPENRVLQRAQPALSQLIAGGGQGAAQQVVEATRPQFQRNLQQGIAEFQSQAPSVFNAASGAGAGRITNRAIQDFNRLAAQQFQQGQQTALQAAGTLGQLGQAAGQAQTQRFVNPTLQLLTAGTQLAQPIPAQVTSSPGIGSQILSGAATVGGAAAGGAFSGGGG